MSEYSLTDEEKVTLLKIARDTLESYLRTKKVPDFKVDSQSLREKRGAFVTLKKRGKLRGCIGRIIADTPLYQTVSSVAIDSALNDPRFPPVQYEELEEIEIEISVLSPFQKIKSLEEIKVGEHGLLIQKGFYSGLLLPQVPVEYNWDKATFLENLCYKAGLPSDAYKDTDAVIYRFSALVFSEADFRE
jgi:AmmeMemoRadiSam system protein A